MADLIDLDDNALVDRVQGGDQRAFRVLMERYQRKIYAVAFGYLRNPDDALDVVQEAFVKVHRYIAKFEGNSSFYTWLYRIVANLCIDQLRRKKRKRDVEFDDRLRHGDRTHHEGTDLTHLTHFGDPRDLMRRKEILAAVHAAMDELSDNHRAVITMREFQGMSYQQMAEVMECSKGTIMSRLFHARKNMQRRLEAQLGPLFEGSEKSRARAKKESNKGEVAPSKASEPGLSQAPTGDLESPDETKTPALASS